MQRSSLIPIQAQLSPIKALEKFISINVIHFQFCNFTKNSTSGVALLLSYIMTASVVESTTVNVILKVTVIVPFSTMSLQKAFSKEN